MTERAALRKEFSDLVLYARGKVRGIYDLGDRLLLVATNRILALDVVFPIMWIPETLRSRRRPKGSGVVRPERISATANRTRAHRWA